MARVVLRWRRFLWASATLAAFIGCAVISYRVQHTGFSHRRHAQEGLTCNACHYGFETEKRAGMPTYKTCLVCHGTADNRPNYPYELEIQKHDPAEAFASTWRSYDLKFSHATHHERAIFCIQCHDAVDAADALSDAHRPAAHTCEECHIAAGIGTACDLCHERLNRSVRPPSHEGAAWMRNHGRDPAAVAMRGHQDSCTLCHAQSSCNRCHQIERPADHTEYFRWQGHGIASGLERERCTVCHQEHFCVRCHRETRPRNHAIASWGGSQSNHCLYCHEPVGSENCVVCHRGTPSHNAAAPLPGPPHPLAGSNCYQCHLRPPHADNFSPCTACHR
ncbi:MAG: cytochrome c3 family protein [Pirellulaceae bacterium]|jgi:hypothetical protein|nr:cytochrome c3 family protein [Pirellulaceae bacterium]